MSLSLSKSLPSLQITSLSLSDPSFLDRRMADESLPTYHESLRHTETHEFLLYAETHEAKAAQYRKQRAAFFDCFYIFAITFTLSCFIIGMLCSAYHYKLSTFLAAPSPQLFDCGNSPDTARAMGCHFDIMSFSWLPAACYDTELSYNFTYAYPNVTTPTRWQWYEDEYGGKPVPLADVETGNYKKLYVTWEYHVVHCVFMWKKLHRAVNSGGRVDSYVGNLAHTEHCARILLDQDEDMGGGSDIVNTAIRMKFPTC